ncbi:MAG: hypothetical protein IJK83_04520 [Clostridiales bacterium]|nr:hypothetical protein [Clostridiales bacterium]
MLRYFLGLSLLTASIIAIRFFADKKISRKFQYALWILIPVYMCIAPFFTIDVSLPAKEITIQEQAIETFEVSDVNTVEGIPMPIQSSTHDEMENRVSEKKSIDWQVLIRNTSLIVSGTLIVVLAVYNFGFISYCRRKRQFIKRDKQYGLRVFKLDHPSAPFLLGNCIYLNEDVADSDTSEYAICHEYCHYKHLDHVWILIRYIVLALNWFNPLIWYAFRLVEEDCELACDEEVISLLGEDRKIEYGKVLLALLTKETKRNFYISTAMNGRGESFMKKRIKNIKNVGKYSVSSIVVAGMAALAMAGCSLIDVNQETVEVSVSSNDIEQSESSDIFESVQYIGASESSANNDEEYWSPYGYSLSDMKYDFGDYYAEMRSYYFDGNTLFLLYDAVNCDDENDITISTTTENVETIYLVSNASKIDSEIRYGMRALITFNETHEACDLIIGSKDSSVTYSLRLIMLDKSVIPDVDKYNSDITELPDGYYTVSMTPEGEEGSCAFYPWTQLEVDKDYLASLTIGQSLDLSEWDGYNNATIIDMGTIGVEPFAFAGTNYTGECFNITTDRGYINFCKVDGSDTWKGFTTTDHPLIKYYDLISVNLANDYKIYDAYTLMKLPTSDKPEMSSADYAAVKNFADTSLTEGLTDSINAFFDKWHFDRYDFTVIKIENNTVTEVYFWAK